MHLNYLVNGIARVCIVLPDILVTLSDAVLYDTKASALWASEGFWFSAIEVSRYLEVLRCPSDQVDHIAAQDHLLLREPITEELVQCDRRSIAKDGDLYGLFVGLYQDVHDCFHELIVIEESCVGVHSLGNDETTDWVGTHKKGIVKDLHELRRMTLHGTIAFNRLFCLTPSHYTVKDNVLWEA